MNTGKGLTVTPSVGSINKNDANDKEQQMALELNKSLSAQILEV